MLNIFRNEQNNVNYLSLTTNYFTKRNIKIKFLFLALIIIIVDVSMYFNPVSCDAPKCWGVYIQNNTNFYYNCITLLFWILVIVTVIKHVDLNKSSYVKWTNIIIYIILANLSVFTLIVVFYTIYILYALFCISDYIISNGLVVNCTPEVFSMEGEINSPIVKEAPLKWKNYVYLSSTNDPSSSTNSQTPILSTTPEEGSQPKILTLNAQSSQKTPIPVHGQGDHPTYFTTANDGEKLHSYNTFNMSDGKVNFCEHTNKDHKWNPRNVWNLDEVNGSCYNCKNDIDTSHYKCEKCYRQLCNSCNKNFNFYAVQNFYSGLNISSRPK